MFDRKLINLNPGLIKIAFPFRGNPQEELALKLSPKAADLDLLSHQRGLPNDVLCYRFWLRDRMKMQDLGENYSGAFMGSNLRDEHIERVEGRVVFLNDSFSEKGNIAELLIPSNLPYTGFFTIRDELYDVLKAEGFNTDKSRWDDYKKWEAEKLSAFK